MAQICKPLGQLGHSSRADKQIWLLPGLALSTPLSGGGWGFGSLARGGRHLGAPISSKLSFSRSSSGPLRLILQLRPRKIRGSFPPLSGVLALRIGVCHIRRLTLHPQVTWEEKTPILWQKLSARDGALRVCPDRLNFQGFWLLPVERSLTQMCIHHLLHLRH